MMSAYGPPNWNAYEDAGASLDLVDQRKVIAHGKRLWSLLGEHPHADAFWNVVAPLVHALAAEGAENAGYGEGFSARDGMRATHARSRDFASTGGFVMTDKDGFGDDDIRRLDEIANMTFNDLIEIPAAHPDLEGLIQALSAAAERLSAVTFEILHPEEPEAVSAGSDR